MHSHEIYFFSGFGVFIATMLALDLGVLNKKDKPVTMANATLMSLMWISFAMIFYFILYIKGSFLHNIGSIEDLKAIVTKYKHPIDVSSHDFETATTLYNHNLGIEFLTGYLVEYALSVDNIFVMLLIFKAFSVDPKNYHRVLFWGILGAVIMRFIFIFLGSALLSRFEWIIYIFGAFLVYSGIKVFIERNKEESLDVDDHPVVKYISKHFKVHPQFVENKFVVKIDNVRMITPLLIVLIIIEFTDVIFAVDSIPAIFAVTKDPYIVFFSNIFAILGLRSMFFFLVNIVHKFHYLKTGLAVLLTFIGTKMLTHHFLEHIGFTNTHSLIVILAILGLSVFFSVLFPKKEATTH